jgi:DNA-directed RNA polymerase subunit RPC12/RpoP
MRVTYAYLCETCGDYDSLKRTGAGCPRCGKAGRRLFVVHVNYHPTKGKA